MDRVPGVPGAVSVAARETTVTFWQGEGAFGTERLHSRVDVRSGEDTRGAALCVMTAKEQLLERVSAFSEEQAVDALRLLE